MNYPRQFQEIFAEFSVKYIESTFNDKTTVVSLLFEELQKSHQALFK